MDRDQSLEQLSAHGRHGSRRGNVWARLQHGAAIVETIIALPLLLVIIFGAIQFGLIYQAKATLNHASLQAARAGAVNNASAGSIRQGLALGLLPLYSPESSLAGVAATLAEINAQLITDARLRVLNPTREAFADFAEEIDGHREIPNDRLHVRSTAPGGSSALNIQDANVLKVQVTYGYELKVPIVNWLITRLLSQVSRGADPFEQQLLRRTRLPILASATVRMQSPARMSDLVVARADLPDLDRVDANSQPADDSQNQSSDGETGDDDESQGGNRGSTLADGMFGFGGGREQPVTSVADSTQRDEEQKEPATSGGETSSGGSQPAEEPLCTATKEDGQSDADGDTGLLGQIWSELKGLAGTAIEFVKGFWEGIKGQLDDLIELITDPLEVAKGLYQLAKEFIDDPPGTARMIGEAIGKDLQQLVYCGSFDRGRVLGSNVDPAFMLKLATKLAKFGHLARALDETERAFGCASFVAGTPVWTEHGLEPIDRLQSGDEVRSRDRETHADDFHAVGQTFNRSAPGYYAVVTETDVLHVTAEHPFWIQGRGWKPVSELHPGDPVATVNGDVLVLQTLPIDSPQQVFNFSVPQTESYFVGKSGIWVHNANCQIPPIYRAPHSPSGYAIGAGDGGAGKWVEITRPDTAAYAYEKQITGAPRNVEYEVGGVKFDGYDSERNVLVDAKRWTEDCPLADCKPLSLQGTVADKMVREAMDQIDAVVGSVHPDSPIEWHVANKEIAGKMEAILNERFRLRPEYLGRITVIFTPDITN